MNNLQRLEVNNRASNRAVDISKRDRKYLHYPISDVYSKKFRYMNAGNAPINYLRGMNPNNKPHYIKYDSFIDIVNDLNQPILNKYIWEQIGYLANERGKVERKSKRPAYNVVSMPEQEEFKPEFEDIQNNPTRYLYSGQGRKVRKGRKGGADASNWYSYNPPDRTGQYYNESRGLWYPYKPMNSWNDPFAYINTQDGIDRKVAEQNRKRAICESKCPYTGDKADSFCYDHVNECN
jgi:hypothetical protein